MPVDATEALTAPPRTGEITWGVQDVLLYHLAIGAGVPATDPGELRYAFERGLRVLPGFATVAGGGPPGVIGALSLPGVDVDLARVLHGGQALTLHRPLPAEGRATATRRIVAVYDKGTAAVLVMRTEVADADGPLWTDEAWIHVRGEGGWGGERGPSLRREPPAGEPDLVVERPVREDQALLYRLTGDRNPLHADPEFAARAGFPRPVLHGLCTYGMTLKAVVDSVLGGDVTRVREFTARFTGVVYPGETLRIRIRRATDAGGRGAGPDPSGRRAGAAAGKAAGEAAGEAPRAGAGRVRVAVGVVERDDAPVLVGTTVVPL
ncbi:MaoC/PaaZ C-terminal domain-containing protein [Streptomyces sp. enrichment culture]|uniref:MaoC/PaaZ C-terminal domain-containing protein n=1 Tax=Streptomyces sp. enrichment culture TaxID=1795815 RepID=UPI003F57ED4B